MYQTMHFGRQDHQPSRKCFQTVGLQFVRAKHSNLCPEIRFDDLRHTHASLLIAAGVHPKAIQARARSCLDYHHAEHLRPPHALGLPGIGSRLEALLQGKLKANKNDTVEATSQNPRQ